MKYSYFLIFVILFVSVTSCNIENKENAYEIDDIKPILVTRSQSEIIDNGNSFAFQLFKDISTGYGDRSFLISPFGLQVALSMLANGAEGETFDQIASALSWGNNSMEAVNQTYKTVLYSIKEVDKTTVLQSANSV